jgi:hypothetical protein
VGVIVVTISSLDSSQRGGADVVGEAGVAMSLGSLGFADIMRLDLSIVNRNGKPMIYTRQPSLMCRLSACGGILCARAPRHNRTIPIYQLISGV